MTLEGHIDFVNSVAFSPDGQRIASGSNDETIKIWDAASGLEVMTLWSLSLPPEATQLSNFSC